MAFFRNDAPGARMIRLTDRTYVLIDAGKIGSAPREKVASVPAGVVEVDDEGNVVDLPELPLDVAKLAQLDHDGDGKPGGSLKQDSSEALKAARAAYKEKFGKLPFNGWPIEELQRRMEATA